MGLVQHERFVVERHLLVVVDVVVYERSVGLCTLGVVSPVLVVIQLHVRFVRE